MASISLSGPGHISVGKSFQGALTHLIAAWMLCTLVAATRAPAQDAGPRVSTSALREIIYKPGATRDAPAGVEAPGPYPADTYTWVTCGPFDLSDALNARVSFALWVDTEQPFDQLSYGASHDDVHYSVDSVSGYSDGWIEVPGGLVGGYPLEDFVGDDSVWWGFFFRSDNMVHFEGVYIDDLLLKKTTSAGGETLKLDGFDGAWPGDWDSGGSDPGTAWNYTDFRSHSGRFSLYCVGGPGAPRASSVPRLSWAAGVPLGVAPERAASGVVRRFEVVYTDIDGDMPEQVRVTIQRLVGAGAGGALWKTFRSRALRPKEGDSLAGLTCRRNSKLKHDMYRYRFRARDKNGRAVGPPTKWRPGPVVDGPPVLFWSGLRGMMTDGVAPNSSKSARWLKFSVCCVDVDGDLPSHRLLIVERAGTDGAYQPFAEVALSKGAGDIRTARYYQAQLRMGEGEYRYRFEIADDDGYATGRPAEFRKGPSIGGG